MSGWKSWINVAEEVQLEVCRELGVSSDVGLPLMRSVDPSDRVLSSLSMYRRHTRIGPCLIKEGSAMPDVPVRRVLSRTEVKTTTENVWSTKEGDDVKMDIVVSGSMT